jgi:predicted dinucleotide-binding enzyme
MPDFDAIAIGTGQAGPSLALRLAAAGTRVIAGNLSASTSRMTR